MITLKDDHEKRPIWITPDNKMFIEAFSPLYKQATEFLIAIAEPVSRPTYIHEYMLTSYSLYAAVSIGMTKEIIFKVLDRLSKNKEIPIDVVEFITKYSSQYGKAKLILKDNRYFIEAVDRETLKKLKEIEKVSEAIIDQKIIEERER
jgi:DNA excision repair protein ERCC-3